MIDRQKKYVFIARGSSHIRYFKAVAAGSSLNIAVIRLSPLHLAPSLIRYARITKRVDLEALVAPHLEKKAIKHPTLRRSVFWPAFVSLTRFLTKFSIAKNAAIIHRAKADVVGVWNGQKQPSAGIAVAARALGKEVIYFENGLLPNTTTCDWSGVNCKNSLPKDAEFYRRFYVDKTLPCELVTRKAVREKAAGLGAEHLPERYIFVPFQVETDSQIISNSPWIKNMSQLYSHLSNVIEQVDDADLHIVIKEHPSEPTRHDHLHQKNTRIVFANHCNTQELIERAHAVMTINSTVGIESLMLGKPVIVLGDACYDIDGVTHKVQSEQAMLKALNTLEHLYSNPEVKGGFLHFLHDHYVIPTTWKNIDEQHIRAISQRLLRQDVLAQSLDDYKSVRSLQADQGVR
ncbi:hypothetical protein HHX48_18035 [Salinimonas sp. HHU 13199]|uniref:Capsular biosynthesis protein n=1 Tax=Salinimonas profundi TaxID=2729140 RepID=A0ABR8LN75_9ALTE|nr:hypothetical protein [Salinimonas profundi]MBD3587641.1 hypothetical protein [Salinimonas profundi]